MEVNRERSTGSNFDCQRSSHGHVRLHEGHIRGHPGPQTRRRLLATAVEDQREQWRNRQRRSRANRNNADLPARDGEGGAQPDLRWGSTRHRSNVWRSANRVSASLSRLLARFPDSNIRAQVLEKVFNSRTVCSLLPPYYPTPEEARAQQQILHNIRSDLTAMKIPHSSSMLARKRAILEAAVSELDCDITNFHTVLGTRKENLIAAVERLRSATTESSSRFGIPRCKRRQGGLSDEVKALVLWWWTKETCVSPRRRHVRRKRLG